MAIFFIILSLILNIIAVMAIIVLYLRQNRLLELDVQQKKNMKEMEEMITSYLLEMKDENELFISRMKEINLQKSKIYSSQDFTKTNENELEKIGEEIDITSISDFSSKMGKTKTFRAVKAYQQTQQQLASSLKLENNHHIEPNDDLQEEIQTIAKKEKSVQDLLIEQLLSMKQEGISVDDMAKKLNKGKTEIELLLKFRENHQEIT
jgi:hypothetical protein